MFFQRKNSDREYAILKEQVVNTFQQLQNGNPFEEPSVTRDKWNVQHENAKKLYKLSKKYSDTVNDVEKIRNIRDSSNERLQYFIHAAEALDYKNAVINIKREYENYNEEVQEDAEDVEKWLDIFRNLFTSADNLYKNKGKFINDGFDQEGLGKAYLGSKYYYAFYLYYLTEINEARATDPRSECMRKKKLYSQCLDVIKGDMDDRIKILKAHIYYEQGRLEISQAEVFETDIQSAAYRFTSYANQAYSNGLKELETSNRVYKISINPIERYIYVSACWDLYSYLLYEKKNAGRAHDYLEREVEIRKFYVNLGLASPEFINNLKEELLLFQKGLFGGWKYIG